jgi:hypothetical protein
VLDQTTNQIGLPTGDLGCACGSMASLGGIASDGGLVVGTAASSVVCKGPSQAVWPFAYELAATPPTVTSISPSSGPTTGGTPVTVRGSGFYDPGKVVQSGGSYTVTSAIDVVIGGVALTGVTLVDDVTLEGTTQGRAAATVDVVVHIPGAPAATLPGQHYLDRLYTVAPTTVVVRRSADRRWCRCRPARRARTPAHRWRRIRGFVHRE